MKNIMLCALGCFILSGCGGSSDDDIDSQIGGVGPYQFPQSDQIEGHSEVGVESDDDVGSGLSSDADADGETGQSTAVITIDNHVEIVGNVLAIYSGKLYGDEILTAPDYSDPTYDELPLVDDLGALISKTDNIVCSNGGTAVIEPYSQELPIDNTLAWNFVFDNCQDGIVVFDGQIERSIYEDTSLSSGGFSQFDQTKRLAFSGAIHRSSIVNGDGSHLREWRTSDMKFSVERSHRYLHIEDSTTRLSTRFDAASLTGEFRVRADWTGDQLIAVQVMETLSLERDIGLAVDKVLFETGKLKIHVTTSEDNTLLLDANTGDTNTVSISIVSGGVSSTFIQPWSLWMDELIFEPVGPW